MAKFVITLTEFYDTKTYRIPEEMFLSLSIRLEPYRSRAEKSKPIICIENGKIFNSAMQVVKWLSEFGIERSYNNVNKIKRICKGQGKTDKVFGFHWQYLNESDKNAIGKRKTILDKWLYYACLKNEVHSKSYKLTEELLNELKTELKPYCTSIERQGKDENIQLKKLRNPIETSITEVELTEKELEYISMLRLNSDFKKHKDDFSMSIAEKNKLYRKFGISEHFQNKDRHLLAIVMINNLAPYEILKKVFIKYNLKECEQMLNNIKNAPKYDDKYFGEINETMISLYEKIKEVF